MEIWAKIKDYPNYEISNIGRVKSINYNKERILKLQNMNGYDRVGLSINGIVN